MIDHPSLLRQLYPPPARVVITWVCTACHRGWPLVVARFWPRCTHCDSYLEPRGAHAAVPLGPEARI
jgi:hypothetical protein